MSANNYIPLHKTKGTDHIPNLVARVLSLHLGIIEIELLCRPWNVTTWRVCLCCFGQCTSYKDCRNAMPGRTNLESKHLRQQAGFFVVCCRLQWILNLVSFLVSLCPVFIIKNTEKMSNQLKSFWPEIHANLLQFFPSCSRRTLQLNWLFRCLSKWGELNIFTVVCSSC